MYHLRVQTLEAYSIKVLCELLQNCIKDVCFVFDRNGISLTGMDTKTKRGTKLVWMHLKAENFKIFHIPKTVTTPLNVGVNLVHLYRMLKTIKKKDTLTLFINQDNTSELGIQIQQNGDNNSTTSFVKITNIHPLQNDPPEGYDKCVVATSREFQKLKSLTKISKYIKVKTCDGKLEFSCDKENVYTSRVVIGSNEHDDHDAPMVPYDQTFETEQIIQLVKVAGLSHNVQIFANPEVPLLFKLNVGHLGTINIYLKSKETLMEKEDDDIVESD